MRSSTSTPTKEASSTPAPQNQSRFIHRVDSKTPAIRRLLIFQLRFLKECRYSMKNTTTPFWKAANLDFRWNTIKDYLFILAGTLVQAFAMRLFLIPGQLVSGGISGAAQLVNFYTHWPIGLMVFIGNAPLFLLGWRHLGGPKFVFRTASGDCLLLTLYRSARSVHFREWHDPRPGPHHPLWRTDAWASDWAWYIAAREPAVAAIFWAEF